MDIIRVDKELPEELRERLTDGIAAIDEAVFGESKWGLEAFTENISNDYDCLLAAVYGLSASDRGKPGLDESGNGSIKGDVPVVAGYALLRCLGDAELIYIAVSEEYRRQGTGKRLLNELINEAEGRNAGSIFLEVRAGNAPAIKMYESAGFTACGIRKGYYHAPKEDAVIMRFEC